MQTTRLLGQALAAGILLVPIVFSQTVPQFEVASVKLAHQAPEQATIGVHVDGARITCNFLNLKDYLRMAYRVKDYQIEGPETISSERYDISATLPAGATRDQVPDMIKNLLADRFHVKLHHESKDFPVYALVLGKGPLKIKESPIEDGDAKAPINVTGGGSRDGVAINLGRGAFFNFSDNKLEAKKLTMAQVAETLARFVDKPVVDMTGLNGTYDILLNFTEEDYHAMLIRSAINAGIDLPPAARRLMESASGDSIFSAIQSVGLKLESRKAPIDVLVVDHADKIPTEN
jgi:uncharacterized protein (TIGR03435 family)